MTIWRNLYENKYLKIGMWPGSDQVYFTYSAPLNDAKELEFLVSIKDLKQVINNAEMEMHKKEKEV